VDHDPHVRPLTIVRHGATKMNNQTDDSADRIRSWLDVPLVEKGREEARLSAAKLLGKGIGVIECSDLVRAHETAQIIGSELGLTPTPTRKLRPWDLGIYTGTSTKLALPEIRKYVCDKPDIAVPEGESFHQFKERFFEGCYDALANHPGEIVLIVTHHRGERVLESWDKTGQPPDHTIDIQTFLQKGDPPGGIKTIMTTEQALKGKLSHHEAGYRRSTGRDRCGNCKAFEGQDDCKKVVPPIVFNGWCKVGVSRLDGHAFDPAGSRFNEAMQFG
jgi:broad specificity phosphatase PhoE